LSHGLLKLLRIPPMGRNSLRRLTGGGLLPRRSSAVADTAETNNNAAMVFGRQRLETKAKGFLRLESTCRLGIFIFRYFLGIL
jgi:hypothetical protein